MYKYLVLTLSFLCLPVMAGAASSWELLSAENNIELKGVCVADVRVELYEGNNFEVDPVYVATAPCVNDAFGLSDDVLRWDIPEGTYKLVVDGERGTIKDFTVKEIVMTQEEVVNRELLAKGLPGEIALSADQVFENAQASFSEKLYGLQLDLVTMQVSLKDTSYPVFIKTPLGGALGVVESTLAKLNEAFFVVEKRDFVETMPTTFENPNTPEGTPDPSLIPVTDESLPVVTTPLEVTPDANSEVQEDVLTDPSGDAPQAE